MQRIPALAISCQYASGLPGPADDRERLLVDDGLGVGQRGGGVAGAAGRLHDLDVEATPVQLVDVLEHGR
jgi:hypothetical protein